MQLTLFSDLSLRLLIYLASRQDSLRATVTVHGAASMFNMSYTHMVKVVHELGRRGFLVTRRGNGGVRLSRSPEQIRIGQVRRKTEGDRAVANCAKPACPLENKCLLKSVLDRGVAEAPLPILLGSSVRFARLLAQNRMARVNTGRFNWSLFLEAVRDNFPFGGEFRSCGRSSCDLQIHSRLPE